MKNRRFLALLALGTFLPSCQQNKSPDLPASAPVVTVGVVKPIEREIPSTLQYTGVFMPLEVLEIKSETSGRIQGLSVSAGQSVSVGDALFRIEDERLPLVLEKQKAELREAEAEQELQERLREGEIPSEAENNNETDESVAVYNEANANFINSGDNISEENLDTDNPDEDQTQAQARRRLIQIRRQELQKQKQTQANVNAVSPEQNEEVADSQHELSESKLERIQAEIAITEKQIESSSLVAPIAGFVSLVKVSEGSLVQSGEVLLQIVVLDPIDLSLKIPKNQIAKVQKNPKMPVAVSDLELNDLSGELAFTDYEIKDQNSVEVRIRVPNPGLIIKKGMEGIVSIASSNGKHLGLMIPASSLLTQDSGSYVYVHDGANAKRRAVETGVSLDGMVEITKGLSKNDEVILQGLDQLKGEGDVVRVSIQSQGS